VKNPLCFISLFYSFTDFIKSFFEVFRGAQNELDFSLSSLKARESQAPQNDVVRVFDHIWRGGMPQTLHADEEQLQEYFSAYVNTYLMRDVTELGGVTDATRFGKFLTACAAIVAGQVNCKTLADAAEISQPTAKEWLRLLESLGIVHLLRPYANNTLKRLVKTPKLYFCDTGLAAYLSRWLTRETLMNGAAAGPFFENHVVAELLRGYAYDRNKANLTYYKDSNTKEIDVFVERNNLIHPLEIKKSANPDRREVRKFSVLNKTSAEQGPGGVVCLCREVVPIDEKNCFIPCNLI
jgi:predicted AAA+ superfamily ATPase